MGCSIHNGFIIEDSVGADWRERFSLAWKKQMAVLGTAFRGDHKRELGGPPDHAHQKVRTLSLVAARK